MWLGGFDPSCALASDMSEVSRRFASSAVQLRVSFMRGLHPFYPPAVDLWQGAIGGTFHGRRGLRHRYYMPRPDRVDQERYTAVGRLLAHCLVQPFAVPPIFPPFLYRWLLTSEPGAPTPSLDDLDLVDIATAQKLRLRLALSDPAQAEQHSETVR